MDNEYVALLIESLHDTKYGHDNVHCAISLIPEFVQLLHCSINIAFHTCSNCGLYNDGVRLVAYFENVVARNKAKSGVCRL